MARCTKRVGVTGTRGVEMSEPCAPHANTNGDRIHFCATWVLLKHLARAHLVCWRNISTYVFFPERDPFDSGDLLEIRQQHIRQDDML